MDYFGENQDCFFCSIRYPKIKSHILIQEIDKILLLMTSQYDFNYIFHVGVDRGEYVGITCVTDFVMNEAFLIRFNLLINEYLKRNKRHINNAFIKGEAIFKNPAYGNLRYSTHIFPVSHFKILNRRDTLALAQVISNNICKILCKDDLSIETLLTFCFYLHILLLKAVMNIGVTDIIDFLNKKIIKSNNEQLTNVSIFAQNEEIFMEIIEDIFVENTMNEDENHWMLYWSQLCTELFSTFNANSEPPSHIIAKFYADLSGLIHKQLGIDFNINELIRLCFSRMEFDNQIILSTS